MALHETNPMLGHPSCSLGITYSEIYGMQAAEIFEAAVAVIKETGESIEPRSPCRCRGARVTADRE